MSASLTRESLSRAFLALFALLLAGACTTPSKGGFRPKSIDPDVNLRKYYDLYASGEDPARKGRGHNTYDADRARHEIEKLAVEFPRHVPTLFTCAAIAYEEGEPELAGSYLDALLHHEPVHPEAAVLRSQIAIRDGNLASAEDLLRQQVRYVPDHAGLRESLAAVLFLRAEYDAALEELSMASRLGAPAWRIDFNLGLVHEAKGELTAAAGYYSRSMEANPDFVQASSRLRGLRARAGEVVQ